MRLDHIHLQNFRCYEDAEFSFHPQFNLVIGVNGSGKTSLLKGIATSFITFINAAASHFSPLLGDEEDVRFEVDSFDNRIRFERRYPLVLTARGAAFGVNAWRTAKERKSAAGEMDVAAYQSTATLLTRLDKGEKLTLPVIAFYRANRRWLAADVAAEVAATEKASRLEGYANWFDAAANLSSFESWVIGKTLERLQDIADNNSGACEFDDELEWVNSAIKLALPDAQGLRYDLRLRTLMVGLAAHQSIPFNDLSDGQRSMVALIADIARRICLLNPHMGRDVLTETPGVVIIDELDIHLHPAWQRSIVVALKNAFPKVQFIAASHSPQIIGSLQPEEVIVLDGESAHHPRVTYGLDSSSILEEVMDVGQRDPTVQRKLAQIFAALELDDLTTVKSLLVALKQEAPDLPEFARIEALIKRKEVIGR